MEIKLNEIDILKLMAENKFGCSVQDSIALAPSGSHRRYYRLIMKNGDVFIGTFNDDVAENQAFFTYTRFFEQKGFAVPHLIAVHEDQKHYLQSDLGDTTLYDLLCKTRDGQKLSPEVIDYYKQVVQALPDIQLSGRDNFDFSVAYPRYAFDRQSMQWDLNYFKYYFLKLANIPFNEQKLEDDYQSLMDYLLTADSEYFLYRDFQSRNIMVHNNGVYFIDYQGGRKGALQYDVASLLYDAKADLSEEFRAHLLNLYLDTLSQKIEVDRDAFVSYFHGFVLIRILQAMGTYGYRGYYERKTHFLQSVPFAVRNLERLLNQMHLPIELPELTATLRTLIASDLVKPYQPTTSLTVQVQSFSFKKGIPTDPSGNGGGFVFDCRALPNPGREKQFAHNTGRDECVIQYLEKYPQVSDFKKNVNGLVDAAVINYIDRKFDHLMVSFGCTGGQHRSVYFAEQMARHLRERFPNINVDLRHIENPTE
ncbi:MAG: phosphotransferase [Bacteroidales bacterium]|nr:phosphotransferase [Bacteroidales bacterium]